MLFLPMTPADSAATRRLPLPAPLPRLAAIVAATSIVLGSTLALDALPAAASENQPPVVKSNWFFVTPGEMAYSISSGLTLQHVTDPEGDPVTIQWETAPAANMTLEPSGALTWDAPADFCGSFFVSFRAFDGASYSNLATFDLRAYDPLSDTTVQCGEPEPEPQPEPEPEPEPQPEPEPLPELQPQPEPAPQQAPMGTPDFYTMNAGQTLAALGAENPLGNDVDPDGNELLMVHLSMQGPALSTWTWNMNGDFWFTPPADYTGSFTVYYTLSDGVTEVPDVPITITVRESLDGAVNAAPVAEDDTWMVAPGEILVIGDPGVLGNDHDADGDALSVFAHTEPAIGSDFALATEGSFTWTAPADFCGVTTFTYSVTDGESDSPSNDATVTIVAGMDREPVDCPEEETVTPGGSDEPTDPEQPIDPELPTDPEQPVDLELPTQPELPELPEPLPTDPELTLTATPREQLAHTGPVSERLFAAAAASALLALALGVFAVIPPRGRRRASTR